MARVISFEAYRFFPFAFSFVLLEFSDGHRYCNMFQCFDAVGWAAGRACGL